jgi:DNA polymerase-4
MANQRANVDPRLDCTRLDWRERTSVEACEHDIVPDAAPGAEQSATRGVLCADLDAMFAAVEMRERRLPPEALVIVGGDPKRRGVVSTCSYAARAFGVRSAMPASQAYRLCPLATFIHPRHDLYSAYSRRVMVALGRFGPLEQVSIDEAFIEIDPSGLIAETGRAAKSAVREASGLVVSVGLAANKLVAKIASDYGKPDGLVVVQPGEEAAFLAPLPIGKLYGVGPKTAARLRELGVERVEDLARLPLGSLRERFGDHLGHALWRHARGLDTSEIVTHRDPKQFSQETTFEANVADRARLWHAIREQSRSLADRLASDDLVARTVTLKLRYGDFTTFTRSCSPVGTVAEAAEIAAAAALLVRTNWQRSRPIRLLGIGVSRFEPARNWRQMPLPGLSLGGV